MAGVLGQTFSAGSLTALYISRVISGFGIGGTTVVPSVYLSEVSRTQHCLLLHGLYFQISPKPIRGLITLQYAACQQLGVVFGFFFNYGVTKHYSGRNIQWQLPTALQLVPALIWGISTIFIVESPRWLLSVNRRPQAIANLARIRGLPAEHSLVQTELISIDLQLLHETELVGNTSQWSLLKETFSTIENRRRFWLMFAVHTFSQWSGANAITQYSPTIFGYLGIAGTESKFLATGIYGIVKFVSTVLFSVFIVDFIGRRRSLMTGIGFQIATLVFVGGYLGATNGMTPAYIKSHAATEHASTAAIVAIFLHAVAWSIGWFSAPYLVNSEIFPTRIRSLNMSIMMALHWAYYFGCSRAMPSLLAATHRYGAFAFFASVCSVSFVFVYFCMPETAGRSLESMDALFERPLYTIYKVAYPTKEEVLGTGSVEAEGKDARDDGYVEEAEHVYYGTK